MLNAHASSAIIAVSDLARARRFYETVLGLELVEGGGDAPLVFRTGPTHLVVYPSEFAGTNKANAVVWGVGDRIEAIAADLKAKGVVFEHYDMDGDLCRRSAPDGRLPHGLVQGPGWQYPASEQRRLSRLKARGGSDDPDTSGRLSLRGRPV